MTEKEYRALKMDSYSSLKCVAEQFGGTRKYKKLYIDGIKDKEDNDDPYFMRIGSMVDCRRFTPDAFDNKYFPANETIERPTGKQLAFAHRLYELTLENMVDGVLEGDFTYLCEKAYNLAECKSPKFPKFLEDFNGSNTEEFYRELLYSTGKELVTLKDMEMSEAIYNSISHGKFTKHLFEGEYWPQLPILGEIDGRKVKGLLDFVIPDHENKILNPWDLKCTGLVQDFSWTYRKNFYYIQHGIYKYLLRHWADENGYADYEIGNFRFLVASAYNHEDPLIFETNQALYEQAWNGFTYRGRKFMGIEQIVAELNWAQEKDIWRMSREDYINKAIRQLNHDY